MGKITIIITLVFAMLIGCVGKDPNEVDTVPPVKPNISLHLGDTGDIIYVEDGLDTLNFYKKEYSIYGIDSFDIEGSGIDAEAGSINKIQVQWKHLPDTDLAYIDIYRFNLNDNDTLKIKSINPYDNSFTDDFSDFVGSALDKEWFYYMDIYDEAGNHTISDTVCYGLLNKANLLGPANNSVFSNSDDIIFVWNQAESSDITSFRILIFDGNRNIIWNYTPLDSGEEGTFSIQYSGEELTPQTYYWRVDAFGDDTELELNGTIYRVSSGSESEERILTISN